MTNLEKVIAKATEVLTAGETIITVTLGTPVMSRADYFQRWKVVLAKLDPSESAVGSQRCIVVTISSNSGTVQVDPATLCSDVEDLPPIQR